MATVHERGWGGGKRVLEDLDCRPPQSLPGNVERFTAPTVQRSTVRLSGWTSGVWVGRGSFSRNGVRRTARRKSVESLR
jgi:hypothetical protein